MESVNSLAALLPNLEQGQLLALQRLTNTEEAHPILKQELTLAAQIAAAAVQWMGRKDLTHRTLAATLVYRYAGHFEQWFEGLSYLSERVQDSAFPSSQRYPILLTLTLAPDYLPYWNEAQSWLVEALLDFDATNDAENLARIVKRFFSDRQLKFTPRPKPTQPIQKPAPIPRPHFSPPVTEASEDEERVICKNCGRSVRVSVRVLAGDGQSSFCNYTCVKQYGDNNMGGYDPMNPRNW